MYRRCGGHGTKMATDIHGEVKITKLDNVIVLQIQSTTNGNKHIESILCGQLCLIVSSIEARMYTWIQFLTCFVQQWFNLGFISKQSCLTPGTWVGRCLVDFW